jgi:hypothetical protein
MVRQTFPHYNCDFCKKETVEKKADDLSSWIIFAYGNYVFSKDHPLLITYMKNGYDNHQDSQYNDMVIHDNLHFCCADCMVKYLLNHLGNPEIKRSQILTGTKVNSEQKTTSRFNDLDLITDKDENEDHTRKSKKKG